MQAFTPTHGTIHSIGELCVGGDWACAHGDLSALRDIALRLAAYLPEPMHCHLTALADACYSRPDCAGELWNRLKAYVYQSADRPEGSLATRARAMRTPGLAQDPDTRRSCE